MKKFALVLLVVLLIGAVSTSVSQVKMSFGPKIGLNLAGASFDPDYSSDITKSSHTGFMGGAAFEVMFSGIPLGIEANLFYAMGGVELSAPGEKLTWKIDEILIPVLLKGKFATGSPVSPYAYIGPALGFVTTSKQTYEATGQPTEEQDVSNNTSGTDFQFIFGGGAEFKVESMVAVTLDLRYGLGLTDLTKNQSVNGRSVKTHGFGILVGCMFTL